VRNHFKSNQAMARRYDDWMAVQHYDRRTEYMYRRTLRMFIEFLGKKSVASVTHFDVRRFIARVSEEGASLDTAYRHLCVLRVFYDFLILGGVVSYVSPRLIKMRCPPKPAPPMLSEAEIQRLITATRTLRERALVEFLYGTGCRLMEARQLLVENVDFVARTARVIGKHGKVRVVLITRSAADALHAYVGNRKSGFVFLEDRVRQHGNISKCGGNWVGKWYDYTGQGTTYRVVQKHLGRVHLVPYAVARAKFEKLVEHANLVRPVSNKPLGTARLQVILRDIGWRGAVRNGKIGPHMIRRSFATHLYDHGVRVEIIQQLLGHSSLDMTLRYTRLSVGKIAEAFAECHPRERMDV
jgi:integrase/recombinase XerD